MLNRLKKGNLFFDKTVFSDEATFHLSGKVTRHNLINCGLQNLHQAIEHVRDRPEVNVFCAVSRTQSLRTAITSHAYLNMLRHFLLPQKSKVIPLQAMVALEGRGGIAPIHS
jgi:hypothetical protein